jgi:hypothetical protein
MDDKLEIMRQRRDAKVHPHLEQYAPVWLVDEIAHPEHEALQFEVVFYHLRDGWTKRRYRFDSFNNVLYYLGQTLLTEDQALEIEMQTPYISAESINTISSYGG